MSDSYDSYVASFAPELREDEDDGYQPVYETLQPVSASTHRRPSSIDYCADVEGDSQLSDSTNTGTFNDGHESAERLPAPVAAATLLAADSPGEAPASSSSLDDSRDAPSTSRVASAPAPAPPPPAAARPSTSRRHRPAPPSHVSRRLLCTQAHSLADYTRRIATEPKVNLEELGCTIERNPPAADYEDFLGDSLKTARVDMNGVKSLQTSVRQLPQSSDSVVRRLTSAVQTMSNTIVGMATIIDGLQMRLEKQSMSIVNASHQMTKLTRMELPKGAFFGEKNVKKEWIIPQRAPFVKTDLKALIRTWVPNARIAKGDFATVCTDFARHYFVRACNPSEAIQQFSVRVSSRGGKKEELKDLPESIVTTLVDFMLEAMGLGQPELDCTSDQLKERPTDFWRGLGRTDRERAAALDYRQSCRQDWRPSCRVSISKALADVRQYVVQSSRLQPKPKRRKLTEPPPEEEEDSEYSSDDLNLEPAPRPSRPTRPSASSSKE